MNKYDEYFDFRIATVEDIDGIMKFLKENWSETHILANDKEFFKWQYGNEHYGDNNSINFVLMLDKEGNIVGINGFVPYAQKAEERYVSSAITKVKADLDIPLCGVELIKRFKQLIPANDYYSSGTNPQTMLPIGKKVFHYTTGLMQQYYILNPEVVDYQIARIVHPVECAIKPSNMQLRQIDNFGWLYENFDFHERFSGQGYKSPEFIKKRYFDHPIYKYSAWGFFDGQNDTCKGVIFGRQIELMGRKILRLVDYLGDIQNLSEIGSALQELIADKGYEYIDLMAGTLPEELMKQSGFTLRMEDDSNIIPTYFEPFVQENINIYFQKSNPMITVFKADGDQDRPNSRGICYE